MPISGKWTEGELTDRTRPDWYTFQERKELNCLNKKSRT